MVKRNHKKIIFTSVLLVIVFLGSGITQHFIGTNLEIANVNAALTNDTERQNEFSVMTWNIAHGRGNRLHQLTTTRVQTKENLQNVAKILNQYTPDFVALQEINAASWWSGNFNHIDYLRENTDFTNSQHSYHVNGLGLSYGTGILTSRPHIESRPVQLAPGVFRPAKGATIGVYKLDDETEITIASIHLHWMDSKLQREQVDLIVDQLKELPRPLVVMGDFNNDWDSTVSHMAKELNLNVQDSENSIVTHPRTNRKLDWILVSEEIIITKLETLDTDYSDHRPVIAHLTLK